MLLDLLPLDTVTDAEKTISKLDEIVNKLLDNVVTIGFKIIAAVLIYIVGRWVIKWLRKFADRVFTKRKIDKTVKSFLDSLINIVLKILLFLMIVNTLGFSMTSFAAILGAAGLAIGMAMKDNLSNFAGGVMLLINTPFKVGDRILAQNMDGTVQSIGILYTTLLTADNKTIFIPNGPLSTGSITNFSTQENRRVDITFNIDYGSDLSEVKDSIQNVIKANPLIKEDPAPFIGVTLLKDHSLDLTIRVWVTSSDYGNVNIDLNEKVYNALSQKGIYRTSSLNVKMVKE